MCSNEYLTVGAAEPVGSTESLPPRADSMVESLRSVGYDLETAARLCGMRYEVALQVAAIAIGIENDLQDED